MKEKRFSWKAFILECPDALSALKALKEAVRSGWVEDCEGLTKEEMEKKGYKVLDEWMV